MKALLHNKEKKLHMLIFILFSAMVLSLFCAKNTLAATPGFKIINGKSYYIKSDGTKQKGWLNLSGKKYLFDERTGEQKIGWQKKSNGYLLRYFKNSKGANGYMVTGLYKSSNGKTWYFNPKNGLMHRGWLYENGNHRYFHTKTGVMYKGRNKLGKYYYYFIPSTGYRYKGGFIKLNGKMYYFRRTDGRNMTGWITDNQKTYYLNTDHTLAKEFKKIGKYYYYFDKKTGVLCKDGFKDINGKTYYLNLSDGHAHIGWLSKDGKKYYFNSEGVMYKNITRTISGVKYTIASDGVVTKYYPTTVTQDNKVKIYDQKNGRYYLMAAEYNTHPGVADNSKSDLDILAALCESEAGDQGKVGMMAVAMCILNRTICPTKEFPSEIRAVIYHQGDFSYPQYSVVKNGSLLRCLNGNYYNKSLAYEAAREAMKIMENYKKTGKPRTLQGFKKDFNYMYFMMEESFWSMPLNFSRVEYFLYKDHMFFVDWA